MKKTVAMFTGQGSQYVGMMKEFYEAYPVVRALYKEAEEVLGFDLYGLCAYGLEEELNRTENAQPAIFLAGVAAFQVYREMGGRVPDFGAGHSLGEITALCCAGVIPFKEALKLVRLRGRLMQEAVPEGVGAMTAVLGLEASVIEGICSSINREEKIVAVSNYNSADQTVISGNREAVAEAAQRMTKAGAVTIPLQVSAPFHCPLMAPCAERLKETLESIAYGEFLFPVISNVTAQPYGSPGEVARYLYEQITKPVQWRKTMEYLVAEQADMAVEFGPRPVLKNLAVKNAPKISSFFYINDRDSIAEQR